MTMVQTRIGEGREQGLNRAMAWQGVLIMPGTLIVDITPPYHLTHRSDPPHFDG